MGGYTGEREPPANININTLTWEAIRGLMALDNTFIGTESYMGMSYFWPIGDYKYLLRGEDATHAKCRRVHKMVLAAGVEVQMTTNNSRWLGDDSGINGATPFVHEAYRVAILKVFKEDLGEWEHLAEWEAMKGGRKLTPCGDVADMDCAQCGALANSDWTWVEWYSDTLCGRCWRENKEGGEA